MCKRQWICIWIAMLFFLLATGCNFFRGYFQIDGFTDKLLEALKTEYGITIPDSAEFIKGNMSLVPQDPSITIYFTLPEDCVEPMLSSDWEESTTVTTLINETSSDRTWRKEVKKTGFLFVTQPEDGLVTALFSGDNPSSKWLD